MQDLQKISIHIFFESQEDVITTVWVAKDYTKQEIQKDIVEKFYPNYIDFLIVEEE